MKIYIVSESVDVRGQLTQVVQCLRGLLGHGVPRVFLAAQQEIRIKGDEETHSIERLMRQHFSIEEERSLCDGKPEYAGKDI